MRTQYSSGGNKCQERGVLGCELFELLGREKYVSFK